MAQFYPFTSQNTGARRLSESALPAPTDGSTEFGLVNIGGIQYKFSFHPYYNWEIVELCFH